MTTPSSQLTLGISSPCLFRVIEPVKWTTYNWMWMNHVYYPTEDPSVLTPELAGHVYHHSFVSYGGAFDEFQKHYWRARYELRLGQTDTAVLYAAVSVEVLASTAYVLYYTGRGRSEEQVREELAEIPFKNVLNREMPRILGGNWDVDSRRSTPGKWYQGAYDLRNRVVHGGYVPKHTEAVGAMEQTDKLHQYIQRLVKRKPRQLRSILDGFRSPFVSRL